MRNWTKQIVALTVAVLVLTSGVVVMAQRRGGGSSGGSFGGSRSFGGGGGSFGSRRSGSSFGGGGSFGSRRSESGSAGGTVDTQGAPRRTGTFGRPNSNPLTGNSGFGNGSNTRTRGSFFNSRPSGTTVTPTPGRRPVFSQSTPTGSFNRTGGFSSSNRGISRGYVSSTNMYTSPGGIVAPVRGYGGFRSYSFYWGAPVWYYHTPFHPAFYFHPPVYVAGPGGGYYQPGGFNFMNLILGIVLIGILGILFFVVILRGIFRLFGGGGSRSQYS